MIEINFLDKQAYNLSLYGFFFFLYKLKDGFGEAKFAFC